VGAYVPEFNDISVSFNQPHTSLWFDYTWLSKPLLALDSSICPPTAEHEQASFVATGPAADPIGQLEQVIESTLGHPEMNLQLIAAIVGTSPRTLQRHLAQHDASFSRLLQAVRFRNCSATSARSKMPLTGIANRLGYTDLANFMRAFKRWTGVGPSEFRRLHYEDGHR
jgi:AraC-like DNA-binding protein